MFLRGLGVSSFARLDILWIPADGVSEALPGQLELCFMSHSVVMRVGLRFLLAQKELSLVVDSELFLVVGEDASTVTHGLEHSLVDDTALPNGSLLLLRLLLAMVFVLHVLQGPEELGLDLGSGVGLYVSRLSLYPPVLVSLRLALLLWLLLLDVREGCADPGLTLAYKVLKPLAGLKSTSCIGAFLCMLF